MTIAVNKGVKQETKPAHDCQEYILEMGISISASSGMFLVVLIGIISHEPVTPVDIRYGCE